MPIFSVRKYYSVSATVPAIDFSSVSAEFNDIEYHLAIEGPPEVVGELSESFCDFIDLEINDNNNGTFNVIATHLIESSIEAKSEEEAVKLFEDFNFTVDISSENETVYIEEQHSRGIESFS